VAKQTGPFGKVAGLYLQNGWHPVPADGKRIDVEGYTGHDGAYPTRAETVAWGNGAYSGHNIAVRMPLGVIGIDVDAYDDKAGFATLQELEDELGELPHTVVSTARDDNVSGIRFFRVPEKKQSWKGKAGSGIDVISWHYRYAVAWPSRHPDTGAVYKWYAEHGPDHQFTDNPISGAIPKVAELPELPQAWAEFLHSDFDGSKSAKMTPAIITSWLKSYGAGEPCATMVETTGLWIDRITDAEDSGGAHDAMLSGVKAVIGDAVAGHSGMYRELTRLRQTFLDAVAKRRTRAEADSEWRRAVFGGVRLNYGTPRAETDPCADGSHDASAFQVHRLNGELVTPGRMKVAPFDKLVEKKVQDLKVTAEARRRVNSETAAELTDIMTLDAWLAQDLKPPRTLVEGMIALDGATLVVAQPKAGKTTFVHNLLRSVADNEAFLNSYDVVPIPDRKRLVLLDFEMHEGLLHEWLGVQNIRNQSRVAVKSLYEHNGDFNIMDSFCAASWASKLKAVNAGYIIIDCLAPALAAVGIEENSNTEVGAWLNAMSMLVRDCGAYGMMIIHHSGKTGESARGASRLEGWTSDNIRLTLKGHGENDEGTYVQSDRFVSARGRVASEFEERLLGYDLSTRRIWINGGSANQVAAERIEPAVIAYIRDNPGCTKSMLESSVVGDNNAIRRVIADGRESGEICNHGKSGRYSLFYGCPDEDFHKIKHKI
jgi:hypothetical protein